MILQQTVFFFIFISIFNIPAYMVVLHHTEKFKSEAKKVNKWTVVSIKTRVKWSITGGHDY
jgi:hypothetical protein